MHRCMLVIALLVLPGCGDDESASTAGGTGGEAACNDGDPRCTCADGFVSDGSGCLEIANLQCAAGTRPALGNPECVPVGWVDCPETMVPNDSGWGCRAVIALSPCNGAAMERVGQEQCVPIGDCTAAFPPAEATYFVDDSFTAAELDGTHFATIAAAVAAAPSGATVAVDAGTYIEGFDAIRPVTVVGRCAEQVVMRSPGNGFGGIQAQNVSGIHIRGMTLEGHRGGAVFLNSEATLEDCLIKGNDGAGIVVVNGSKVTLQRSRIVDSRQAPTGQWGYGALVQLGGQLTVVDSAIVRNQVAGIQVESPTSIVSVERSVIRDGMPATIGDLAGTLGSGVSVLDNGTLKLTGSAIINSRHSAVFVEGAGATATIDTSWLAGATIESDGENGGCVEVLRGATATITDSAVTECAGFGLAAALEGAQISATRVTVTGSYPFDVAQTGLGVVATQQGKVIATDIAIVGTRDAGILVQDPGSIMTITGAVVRDTERGVGKLHADGVGISVSLGGDLTAEDASVLTNRLVGVAVRTASPDGSTSHVKATRLLVYDTRSATDGSFGHGIHVGGQGRLELLASAIVQSRGVGLVVAEAGTTLVSDSVIRDTLLNDAGALGYGLLGLDGSMTRVEGTTIRSQATAGLVFSNAAGGISRSIIAGCPIAVQVQDGSAISEVDELPSEVRPQTVNVTTETVFQDNQVRVGADVVALPAPLE